MRGEQQTDAVLFMGREGGTEAGMGWDGMEWDGVKNEARDGSTIQLRWSCSSRRSGRDKSEAWMAKTGLAFAGGVRADVFGGGGGGGAFQGETKSSTSNNSRNSSRSSSIILPSRTNGTIFWLKNLKRHLQIALL